MPKKYKLIIIASILITLFAFSVAFYSLLKIKSINKALTQDSSNKKVNNRIQKPLNIKNKNQKPKEPAKQTELKPSLNPKVKIQIPRVNSYISSPLHIKGYIPKNWAFENTFPISLEDAQGNKIKNTTVAIKLISPNGEDEIYFEAVATFSKSSGEGYLVIENDNPSGLPEKKEVHKIPVQFAKKDFQTYLKSACSYKGQTKTQYLLDPLYLPVYREDLRRDAMCFSTEPNKVTNAYVFVRDAYYIYDDASEELGHGGPRFLGTYGIKIYNKDDVIVTAYVIPSLDDPINYFHLRAERAVTPKDYETIYVNYDKEIEITNDDFVKQARKSYLQEGSSTSIDSDKFSAFEQELMENYRKLNPNVENVINEMVRELNLFKTR